LAADGAALRPSTVAAMGVAAGAAVLAVLLQVWSGAYRSEFGAHPDESAHYVTGVMVREYLAGLAPEAPLRFAADYYAHYPKVALGHWPPAFYLLQAGWTLPFSSSRVSVLLLMAALTTALATTLFVALREVGGLIAAAAAALLVALPLVQKASGMVMAEIPLALLCFWAVLAFGRFLDFGRAADAVLWGVASAAAILTKGNAFAIAVAAPIALLLTRRWERLARPALWASIALVAALCAPWYVVTARMTADNFAAGRPTIAYSLAALRLYTPHLVLAGGFGLALLAAIGLADAVIRPWRRRAVRGKWAAAAALLFAAWAFHCMMPSSREPRHMVMAAPALMMFVAAGMAVAVRWAGRGGPHPKGWRWAVVGATAMLFAGNGFAVPAKAWSGFSAAVEALLRSPSNGSSTILIVSDVRGEGMFISEIAMREPRPHRRVLRASKVMAQSGWNGEGYRLLYHTDPEVLAYLEGRTELIVLDTSGVAKGEEHLPLVTHTVRSHPERFESLGYFPVTRAGQVIDRAIEVWRLRPARPPTPPAGGLPGAPAPD
jgi:dolichyl-phosphate-mannose-protein mannosyltransferase